MLIRIIFIFWELPQFLLAVFIFFAVRGKITGKLKYKNSVVYFVKGFPGGISLSFIIFLDDREKERIRSVKHEFGHTKQSFLLGWLYLPIIGVPSIIRASVWNRKKLEPSQYYKGYPENWADILGGVSQQDT